MLPLPTVPPAVGVENSSTITPEASESPQISADSVENMAVTPFHEALEQSLQVVEEQLDSPLGWPVVFQLDQSVKPLTPDAGRSLPFVPTLDGKSLPLAGALVEGLEDPLPVAQAGSFRSEMAVERQSAFPLDRLMPGRSGDQPLPVLSGERLLQAPEVRAGSELASQFTLLTPPGGTSAPPLKPSVVMSPIDMPVGQPGWDKAMGERIQWMLGRQIQHAEVKLTPPHLGPLEIRISVQQDQASVSFMVAQAPAREALEAAIPRLREMFGDANLNLANVDVGHREDSRSTQDQAAAFAGPGYAGVADSDSAVEPIASREGRVVSRGLVDHYV